jgi:hypothetical protein
MEKKIVSRASRRLVEHAPNQPYLAPPGKPAGSENRQNLK